MNVTRNEKHVVEDLATKSSLQQVNNRGKLKVAVDNSARASTDFARDRETDEEVPYSYKGPKNTTGIYKNSLVLKELTDFIEEEEPNTHDKVNETMDAGTQTIVHEEPVVASADKEMTQALDYKRVGVAPNTQAVTPRNRIQNFSTKRNSVEGQTGLLKDDSLDRLDIEAQSLNPYLDHDGNHGD